MTSHGVVDGDDGVDGVGNVRRPSVILTANEVLLRGLKLARFTPSKINRIKTYKSKITKFKRHYGCNHFVAVKIFEDLQTTDIEEAMIPDNKVSIKYFLMALNFLYVYDVEDRREPLWNLSPKTIDAPLGVVLRGKD